MTRFSIKTVSPSPPHFKWASTRIRFRASLHRVFSTVMCFLNEMRECHPGPDSKMPSYQYRKFLCGDKTVVRSSYLHNGISCTGKMAFFLLNQSPGQEELRWLLHRQKSVTNIDCRESRNPRSWCSETYDFTLVGCKLKTIHCRPFLYCIYCLL